MVTMPEQPGLHHGMELVGFGFRGSDCAPPDWPPELCRKTRPLPSILDQLLGENTQNSVGQLYPNLGRWWAEKSKRSTV